MYILLKSVEREMEVLGEFEDIRVAGEVMGADVLDVIGDDIDEYDEGSDYEIQIFEDSGYAWFNCPRNGGVNYDWKIQSIPTLNTMKSFTKGFHIKRNGQIITMNDEEMSDFRYLDKAVNGQSRLDNYQKMIADETEEEIINHMRGDEEICYNIERDILDEISTQSDEIARDVIHNYILKQMKGQ